MLLLFSILYSTNFYSDLFYSILFHSVVLYLVTNFFSGYSVLFYYIFHFCSTQLNSVLFQFNSFQLWFVLFCSVLPWLILFYSVLLYSFLLWFFYCTVVYSILFSSILLSSTCFYSLFLFILFCSILINSTHFLSGLLFFCYILRGFTLVLLGASLVYSFCFQFKIVIINSFLNHVICVV